MTTAVNKWNRDVEQCRCPVHDSSSVSTPTSKVQVFKEVHEIFALPVQEYHEPYHGINPKHAETMKMVSLMLDAAGSKVEDGILRAKELLKERVNPELMRDALSVYLTHSKDAQQRKIFALPLKNHAFVLSARPVSLKTECTIRRLATVTGEICTADTLQGPALLSYWRDDYDFNDSHYHWHMVFRGAGGDNSKNVRIIDRQAELFLYTHSQMVARYETEGICWGLPLVRPWNLYDDVLEHGFAPLPALMEHYGGYPPFSSWYPIKNPGMPETLNVTISRAQLEEWRDNIYEAIRTPETKTKPLTLTGENCLNIIGGIFDAQYASLNELLEGCTVDEDQYGNLHNYGLGKFAEIAYRNNPTETSPYGLMISNFGAPRDPCFSPWYKHLQYFGRLAAAKYPQGITAHRAEVILSTLLIRPQDNTSPHYLGEGFTTFLGPPAVDLLESKAKLGHEPYEWSVEVKSSRKTPPSKDNDQNLALRFVIAAKDLQNDYHSWIEMGKVTVHLTDESTITTVRLDTDSAVVRKMRNYSEPHPNYNSPWSRCGWPQNMMLPVGKIEGMPFVAFCMATDDTVAQDNPTPEDQKYPDPRGMGYPFNRAWTQIVTTGKASISALISNTQCYPFITTSTLRTEPACAASTDMTYSIMITLCYTLVPS
ncbi:hypothetical protein BDW59DRAFT_182397 [Aspergillus cavernicola]|uniref:Uncharacterized protein n=1 Tax=Aspergillus cavernicola TaxID=176166 RepID=A0ABR4HMS7_9EURO